MYWKRRHGVQRGVATLSNFLDRRQQLVAAFELCNRRVDFAWGSLWRSRGFGLLNRIPDKRTFGKGVLRALVFDSVHRGL